MKSADKTVVLITGASSGIGKAAARLLIEKGYIVYGAARRVEKMVDLKQIGGHILHMDVTDDTSILEGVSHISQYHGGVDVLINNAGYGCYGAIEDVPLADARRQFEVNLFGLARLTQLVLPHMRKNRFGKIVNISSIGAKIYSPMAGWYHATKFALEGLSDCLRVETQPFGIDVVIIEPGGIKTEWDDTARKTLLKTSGDTAYSELAQKQIRLMQETYENPKITDPAVIAEVIWKAITAGRPKTRYAKGYRAGLYLFGRKVLSDRMFDKALSFFLK